MLFRRHLPRIVCRLAGWPVLRDRRGAVMALFAVGGTAVIGMVSLGTEVGLLYLTKRKAQNAADMASYAGAVRLSAAQSTLQLSLANAQSQASLAATDAATQNGFTAGSVNGTATTVIVNTPPASPSAFAGQSAAVQVIVQRTVPRLLSGLVLSTNPTVAASSTATMQPQGSSSCVLALSGGIVGSGSVTINAQGCTIGSNATGSSVTLSGAPQFNASLVTMAGTCVGCSGLTAPVKQNQPALTDPFAYLQSHTFPASCPGSAVSPPSGSGNVSNPTGTVYWCSTPTITGNVNLAPGTYILYNSYIKMSSGSITCTACTPGGPGVTMIFTGSSPGQVGSIMASGTPSLSWNAPKSGPYAGIALYRDAMGANGSIALSGDSVIGLIGGIYLPTASLTLSGGSAVQDGNCHVIVAASIVFSGGSAVGSTTGCASTNTATGPVQVARLVE